MQSPLTTGKLSVSPGFSGCYCLLLAALYLLVAYVVLRLNIGFWLMLFLMFALVLSFAHELCTQGFRVSSNAITEVECQHGNWLVRYRNKTNRRFERVENVVVLEWLVVLIFRDGLGGKTSIPIFIDSLSAREFRHLRGYLNLKLDHQLKPYPKVGGIRIVSTGSASASG